MFINKKIFSALAFLSVMSFGVNAEFIKGDLYEAGGGGVVYDTEGQLEWASVTLTTGKSLNEVSSLLKYGLADGFRLATLEEVTLMFSQFLTEDKTAFLPGKDDEFRDYFGYHEEGGIKYTYGFVESEKNESLRFFGARDNLEVPFYNYQQNYYDLNYSSRVTGVFLVSDEASSYSAINDPNYLRVVDETINNVPSPTGLWLLPAFLGLLSLRKKTK